MNGTCSLNNLHHTKMTQHLVIVVIVVFHESTKRGQSGLNRAQEAEIRDDGIKDTA